MTQLRNLNPGDRFYFGGDWQTEPGWWTVKEHDGEISMTLCHNDLHGDSYFFKSHRVDTIETNDAQATA